MRLLSLAKLLSSQSPNMFIHKMGVSPSLPGGGDRLRDPAGLWGKKKPGLTSSALTLAWLHLSEQVKGVGPVS